MAEAAVEMPHARATNLQSLQHLNWPLNCNSSASGVPGTFHYKGYDASRTPA
jgi:hypothetical protein